MSTELQDNPSEEQLQKPFFEQKVPGSRKTSNFIYGALVSIGGIGFILASISSYFGKDLLPVGHPSTLIFVPQGLIMGLYGIAAALLAIYIWTLVTIDFGAGSNRFDKGLGILTVTRKGAFKLIKIEIPLKDVKAVKLEIRDGINPRRRIALRVQGRNDLPLTGIGSPLPLLQLEKEGAELARFLDVNLEGL